MKHTSYQLLIWMGGGGATRGKFGKDRHYTDQVTERHFSREAYCGNYVVTLSLLVCENHREFQQSDQNTDQTNAVFTWHRTLLYF